MPCQGWILSHIRLKNLLRAAHIMRLLRMYASTFVHASQKDEGMNGNHLFCFHPISEWSRNMCLHSNKKMSWASESRSLIWNVVHLSCASSTKAANKGRIKDRAKQGGGPGGDFRHHPAVTNLQTALHHDWVGMVLTFRSKVWSFELLVLISKRNCREQKRKEFTKVLWIVCFLRLDWTVQVQLAIDFSSLLSLTSFPAPHY